METILGSLKLLGKNLECRKMLGKIRIENLVLSYDLPALLKIHLKARTVFLTVPIH